MSPLVLWNGSAWVDGSGWQVPDSPLEGWPSVSNTGYLGDTNQLVAMSGTTLTTPNQIIENRIITDAIRPEANNITIRNCVINAGYYGVFANTADGAGLIVEDCTIIGGSNCGVLIDGPQNVTIRRCNLSGGADGMKIGGNSVTVQDCYIHDLHHEEGDHNDGIQVSGGTNLQFIHNWIESIDTSCIGMFDNISGTYVGTVVRGNHLSGSGYPLYAGGAKSTGMIVEDNEFINWGTAPVTYWNAGGGNVWSNNTRADTGALITP